LLLAPAACQEDLEDISQVTKFRVLAVQTDPPEVLPGESTELNVLTADPAGGGRKITAVGFAVTGLITPSSTEIDQDDAYYWPLEPTEAVDGAIAFGSLGVPEELADQLPVDECDTDDEPYELKDKLPLKVTVVILLCAGDGLSDVALLAAFAELASSMGPESETSLDLSEMCVQAGADEGLTAMKTFSIYNRPADDPQRNANPEIDGLLFSEAELPTAGAGGHGVYQCTSSDGCREGVPLEIWLTDESYQQYGKQEFCETKTVDERIYISWFTDGGSFSADRSGSNDPLGPYEVDWLPPREGGAYTLWAVAHDVRGGVSWKTYSVEALPPP
jgi:hypothetical protein